MRQVLLALCMTLGLTVAGLSSASAAPMDAALGKSLSVTDGVTKVWAGYCEDLRYRCLNKEDLGGWGRGYCHRYRIECGHARYCERLRQACRYKYERGEEGMGNCRRYKYECSQ
jgi:hypothetical protein